MCLEVYNQFLIAYVEDETVPTCQLDKVLGFFLEYVAQMGQKCDQGQLELYNKFIEVYCQQNNCDLGKARLGEIFTIYKVFLEGQNKATKRDAPAPYVKLNDYGNLEHSTGIVFVEHPQHQYVAIGLQDGSTVRPLTMKQVVICSSNGWYFAVNHCIKSAATLLNSPLAVTLE